MQHPVLDAPISPLRQRLIDDMNMRPLLTRDAAQLSPRHWTPGDVPRAFNLIAIEVHARLRNQLHLGVRRRAQETLGSSRRLYRWIALQGWNVVP
jgi:hypothetical protein